MTALPPDADVQSTHSKRAATASASGEDAWERRANNGLRKGRWIGWRLRALVAAALCGCLALLLLVRALGAVPALDEALYGDDSGVLRLEAPSPPSHAVRSLVDGSGNAFALDTLVLHRSPRWLVDDHQRAQQVSQHDRLGAALAAGPVQLVLDDGRHVTAQVRATRQQRPRRDVLARQCARDAALSGDHGRGPGTAQSAQCALRRDGVRPGRQLVASGSRSDSRTGVAGGLHALGPWPAQWS